MDSLHDILSRKDFDEPPESLAIKDYVRKQFDETVAVQVREHDIIIATPSAALAATLRLQILTLQELVGTKKRLIFRIGK